MYRKPIYLNPLVNPKLLLNEHHLKLTMEIPEGKKIGISGISKNWKPKNYKIHTATSVNHQQEMKIYRDRTTETKESWSKTQQENKKQNYHPRSQSSYRPQRYKLSISSKNKK